MKNKILVVDDSETILKMLKTILESEGFEVITVSNGLKIFEYLKKDLFDLIMLDVMLPGIDGYHLCRLIKFDENYKNIPIVMLTSRDSDEDREKSKLAGADCYLVKTFDNQKIVETVKNIIRNKKT